MLAIMEVSKERNEFEQRENVVSVSTELQVVMKSTIFFNVTPCSPLSVNRRFGGTAFLAHLIFSTLKM
jgi:hypothetical protein